MIKNYFKTAVRNLWRNKTTSFINLFGLAVGMTAAVFIFLWVQNEISFDSYHPDKENIYLITNTIKLNKDESLVWEHSPTLMAEMAEKELPEVKNAARIKIISWQPATVKVNNNLF